MKSRESILILGGQGMLAHALARQLRRQERRFTALGSAEANLKNPAHLRQQLTGHAPTIVFNCAAFTQVDKCEEVPDQADAVNGHGVGTLADLSNELGFKLVHVSTDFVFDGSGNRPYRPNDPPAPLSAYGRSKLLGEQRIRQANPPGWIIARTAWLYGPNGQCFPNTMLTLARQGKALKVVNDQIGGPTFTLDLAEALLHLVDAQACGIFHLANAGQTSWYEFTRAIFAEFGVSADLSSQSSAEYKKLKPQSAHRPQYSVLDTSDYTRATGQTLPHWQDGLRRYRVALGDL